MNKSITDWLWDVVLMFWDFAVRSVKVLAHPENRRDWKTAWSYFWVPVVIAGLGVTGGGVVLIMWLLPNYIDIIATVFWLVFMACQYYAHYIEGDGFEDAERWIDEG